MAFGSWTFSNCLPSPPLSPQWPGQPALGMLRIKPSFLMVLKFLLVVFLWPLHSFDLVINFSLICAAKLLHDFEIQFSNKLWITNKPLVVTALHSNKKPFKKAQIQIFKYYYRKSIIYLRFNYICIESMQSLK